MIESIKNYVKEDESRAKQILFGSGGIMLLVQLAIIELNFINLPDEIHDVILIGIFLLIAIVHGVIQKIHEKPIGISLIVFLTILFYFFGSFALPQLDSIKAVSETKIFRMFYFLLLAGIASILVKIEGEIEEIVGEIKDE